MVNGRVLIYLRVGRYETVSPGHGQDFLLVESFTPYLSSILLEMDYVIRFRNRQVRFILGHSSNLGASASDLFFEELMVRVNNRVAVYVNRYRYQLRRVFDAENYVGLVASLTSKAVEDHVCVPLRVVMV